jgi:hypothetical protein
MVFIKIYRDMAGFREEKYSDITIVFVGADLIKRGFIDDKIAEHFVIVLVIADEFHGELNIKQRLIDVKLTNSLDKL